MKTQKTELKFLAEILLLNCQIKTDSTKLVAMQTIYDYSNMLAYKFQNEQCDKYGFAHYYNSSHNKLSRIYCKIGNLERKIDKMRNELFRFVRES